MPSLTQYLDGRVLVLTAVAASILHVLPAKVELSIEELGAREEPRQLRHNFVLTALATTRVVNEGGTNVMSKVRKSECEQRRMRLELAQTGMAMRTHGQHPHARSDQMLVCALTPFSSVEEQRRHAPAASASG